MNLFQKGFKYMSNIPSHLLTSLGVLSTFSIAKRISREEIEKTKKQIKKVFKDKKGEELGKLLTEALIDNTRKYLSNEVPPGFIIPKVDPKKEKLDKFYNELAEISKALSNKFIEQKLTKFQICFILNALVNLLKIEEDDFEEFHKKFSKYRENDFDDTDL